MSSIFSAPPECFVQLTRVPCAAGTQGDIYQLDTVRSSSPPQRTATIINQDRKETLENRKIVFDSFLRSIKTLLALTHR